MVATVVSNSAAGFSHPDDPALRIPMVAGVSATGIPTEGGAHSYAYNAAGQMTTDTWTVANRVYIKTYTWNGLGQLTNQSDWVLQ